MSKKVTAPIAVGCTLTNIPEYNRYARYKDFSIIGDVLGIVTVQETTVWIHANDIVTAESDPSKPYQTKLFVQGRTSPIFVVVDLMELCQAITTIRSKDK